MMPAFSFFLLLRAMKTPARMAYSHDFESIIVAAAAD
jgi:hypothetical protein